MSYINSVIKITNKSVFDFICDKQHEMKKTTNGDFKIKVPYENVIQKIIEEHIILLKKKR